MIPKNQINNALPGSLLFLKYKGILLPQDYEKKYEFYGYKCKKYSRWPDIFVTENSKKILSVVGDSLLDSKVFPIQYYDEISRIWERVHRWVKDKEDFLIEPDLILNYEKILRLNKLASDKPEFVDSFIAENNINLNEVEEVDRWLLFCCIQLIEFIKSEKRISFLYEKNAFEVTNSSDHIPVTASLIHKLLDYLGLPTNHLSGIALIFYFIDLLGLISSPNVTKRDARPYQKGQSTIFVEFYEGPKTEFVKFIESEGNIIIKLNKLHKANNESSKFYGVFSNTDFWMVVGESLKSHIGSIDDISSYFDTLGKKIHLYK